MWKLEHTWPVEKDVEMLVSDTNVEAKYFLNIKLVSSTVNIINALEKNNFMEKD